VPLVALLLAVLRVLSGELLLGHTLLGVPLGLHVGSAHGPGQLAVFGALYAVLAGVGYANFRKARRATASPSAPAATPGAELVPYLSFGTVLFAALVPLAAALYLVTTTAWTAAERAWLHRETPTAQPVPAA
jgi:YidC/Oxa1 family membrane protein insertase